MVLHSVDVRGRTDFVPKVVLGSDRTTVYTNACTLKALALHGTDYTSGVS